MLFVQNKMIKMKKALPAGRQGFSLFELLVSISIIGILVALVSISYSSAQKKARDARRMQDLGMIQKAAEQYYSLNSYNYPPAIDSYNVGQNWTIGTQEIIASVPGDPKTGAAYSRSGITTSSYCICAQLENLNTGNADNGCIFAAVQKDFYCVKNQQ